MDMKIKITKPDEDRPGDVRHILHLNDRTVPLTENDLVSLFWAIQDRRPGWR